MITITIVLSLLAIAWILLGIHSIYVNNYMKHQITINDSYQRSINALTKRVVILEKRATYQVNLIEDLQRTVYKDTETLARKIENE